MVGTRNRQAQDIKKSFDFQRESFQTGLFSHGSLFSYPHSFLGKYAWSFISTRFSFSPCFLRFRHKNVQANPHWLGMNQLNSSGRANVMSGGSQWRFLPAKTSVSSKYWFPWGACNPSNPTRNTQLLCLKVNTLINLQRPRTLGPWPQGHWGDNLRVPSYTVEHQTTKQIPQKRAAISPEPLPLLRREEDCSIFCSSP